MVTLFEPSRGKYILGLLNHLVSSNQIIFHSTSIAADIFVFLYPILLIGLVIQGTRNQKPELAKGSFKIFWGVLFAVLITIIIQQLIRKDRPESLPGLQLILQHVPTISFPSDHATVSAAIAAGTWLLGKGLENSTIKQFGFILFVIAILMGLARVAVAVHRPTDILAWWAIWIFWWYIWYKLCESKIINKCIDILYKIYIEIILYLPYMKNYVNAQWQKND